MPVEKQAELKEKVGSFLGEQVLLNIDGQNVAPSLNQIDFLKRTLRASTVIKPAEELDAVSTMLGAIFVYPISNLPQKVSLTWDLFSPKMQVARSAATDEAGSMPYLLSPDDNVLKWQNFLKNPTIPKLTSIAPPESVAQLSLPVISTLCFITLVPIGYWAARSRRAGAIASVLALVLAAFVTWPFARASVPNPWPNRLQFKTQKPAKWLGPSSGMFTSPSTTEMRTPFTTLSREA